MKPACAVHKNAQAAPNSSGVPRRPAGFVCAMIRSCSSTARWFCLTCTAALLRSRSVSNGPGSRLLGSVRTRASQCRLKWDEAHPGSCGLQDDQHGHTPPEVEQSAAIGGNMLMGAGAEAEEVAQFIVSATEPGG